MRVIASGSPAERRGLARAGASPPSAMAARAWIALFLGVIAGCSLDRSGVFVRNDGDARPSDARVEHDGRALDGGSIDGGSIDGGSIDAGAMDASTDARVEAGRDASGTDARPRCVVGERRCVDERVVECGPDTSDVLVERCALGCSMARCRVLRPSNVTMVGFLDGALDAVISSSTTIDTSPCDGPNGVVAPLEGGGDACVVRVRDLVVPATAVLRVVGVRPLVVLATRNIAIDGALDASAYGATPGPGGEPGPAMRTPVGGRMTSGIGGSTGIGNEDGGGGGGGLCGIGGAGANGLGLEGLAGSGGPASGFPFPLAGGAAGGAGAGPPESHGVGGAGGGAVQLTARGSIRVSGRVLAGGGGGGGATGGFVGEQGAGAGGGSGGAVLLEAFDVHVESIGAVWASGGGGGGAGSDATLGGAGQDGALSGANASGGPGPAGSSGGSGGGGAAMINGSSGTAGSGNGGGGGGGAGCLRVRAVTTRLEGSTSPSAAGLDVGPPVVVDP